MPARKIKQKKQSPAKKAQSTLVTFLLDRTGSMDMCKGATIEAFNTYLGTLKADPKGIYFTFLQFDSESLDRIHVAEPVGKISNLSSENYKPRASTPLIDACVKTIRAVEESLKARDDNPKIVICFQTDGQENASVEHKWDELTALIKAKTELGWQFNFMGTGIDAYAHARQMGIMAENAMSYDSRDLGATKAAFAASASNTMSYARGLSSTMAYSAPQRMSAKDHFAPADLVAPAAKPKMAQPLKKKGIVDNFKL